MRQSFASDILSQLINCSFTKQYVSIHCSSLGSLFKLHHRYFCYCHNEPLRKFVNGLHSLTETHVFAEVMKNDWFSCG